MSICLAFLQTDLRTSSHLLVYVPYLNTKTKFSSWYRHSQSHLALTIHLSLNGGAIIRHLIVARYQRFGLVG